MAVLLLVSVLGIAGGFLTTVAGMGGGLLLVTSLAVLWGPHVALPVTALALLLGALLVADMPAALLQLAMLALVGLALARVVFRWEWVVPRAALAPAGGAVGVMASAGGGAPVQNNPHKHTSRNAGDQ